MDALLFFFKLQLFYTHKKEELKLPLQFKWKKKENINRKNQNPTLMTNPIKHKEEKRKKEVTLHKRKTDPN